MDTEEEGVAAMSAYDEPLEVRRCAAPRRAVPEIAAKGRSGAGLGQIKGADKKQLAGGSVLAVYI